MYVETIGGGFSLGDSDNRTVKFTLGGMNFEYDEEKNRKNIEKHVISFKSAARIFFDYDRIEFFDEENSEFEDRFDTIGDLSAGMFNWSKNMDTMIGSINENDVLFVVYTEKIRRIYI